MRKTRQKLVLIVMGLCLLLAGGVVSCGEEEVIRQLVAPEVDIGFFYRDATVVPADPNDMAAMTVVMDMALNITNPNDFEISAQSFLMRVFIDGQRIEDPNYLEKIYIPGNESVTFHRRFVVQPMAIIIDLMMGTGKSFMDATAIAMPIWNKVTADTAKWDLECRAVISSEWGDKDKTYQLSWTKPS